MARVKFKDGERQELHGTFCGMVFTYRYGKQHVQLQRELPKPKNRKQLAKWKRDTMVRECIADIQKFMFEQSNKHVADMQRIADKYEALKKACERMYEDFLPYFKTSPVRLQGAIVYWYKYKQLAPKLELFRDELPEEYRTDTKQ